MSTELLGGVRVLDVSRALAGPLATQILADFGAQVLKVEPPWGDHTRGWGPPFQGEQAAYYQSANRNKSSLVLNLREEADRTRAARLAQVSDVVVDNYLPGVRRNLGLDAETLRRATPSLVCVNIVGYGGSRSDDPAFDLVLQAESGFMGMSGPADGAPSKLGVAIVDVLTGMMASNAVLAALVRRGRTGEGASLTVSLLRSALFSLVNVATNHFVSGRPTPRWGNDHANLVPYGAFRTSDRTIVIGVGTDDQYESLLRLLGLEGSPLGGLDNAGRIARRSEVNAAIQEVVADRSSEGILAALAAEKIPSAPVLRPDEALAAAARFDPGAILAVEHPDLGDVRLVANPIEGDGMRPTATAPPRAGEGGEAMERRWLENPASLTNGASGRGAPRSGPSEEESD